MNQPLSKSTTGYYEVGNRIFVSQLEALHYASTTKQTVSWNFHNDVYSQYNWSKRPSGTLDELYKLRAQQIRDKYDYVVVHFSGGSDSWNILHSFLSNGIHIDEIYTRWAFDELKYKDYDPTNLDEYNIISEYKYTVIPVLEHIKKTYPKTKIVVDDYSPLMQGEFQESDLAASIQYHHIGAYVRWAIPSEGQLSAKRQGKSVGLVYGQDKIRFQIKDNKFYAHFIECLGGTDSLDYNQELFYWTVDFPTIPILQAHYIKDHFIEFPNERGFFTGGRDMTKMYQKICYPQYNSDTFQVGKPMGVMHRKSDAWIYAYNRKYYDSWQWSMKQFYDTIDESYLSFRNGNFVVGTKKMSSPLYYVGTLPDSFQVDIDINGQTPF